LSSYEREKPNATFNSGLKRERWTILSIKCNLNQGVFKLYKTKRLQTNTASTCSVVVAHLSSIPCRGFEPLFRGSNPFFCFRFYSY
jgi:hypothetical protein